MKRLFIIFASQQLMVIVDNFFQQSKHIASEHCWHTNCLNKVRDWQEMGTMLQKDDKSMEEK